jgi:hypothetical protein
MERRNAAASVTQCIMTEAAASPES